MFRISPMRKLLVPELEFGRGAGRLRPGAVWLILVVAGLCVAAGVARHFQIARIHADDVAVVFAIMVIDAGAGGWPVVGVIAARLGDWLTCCRRVVGRSAGTTGQQAQQCGKRSERGADA